MNVRFVVVVDIVRIPSSSEMCWQGAVTNSSRQLRRSGREGGLRSVQANATAGQERLERNGKLEW